MDHPDAQKILWGEGGLSLLLQVLTGTWGECHAEQYRSPLASRDKHGAVVMEQALYATPSRYKTTGSESYIVSAAACLRHLLGVHESHEMLLRGSGGGMEVVLWLLRRASSTTHNLVLQEQALGACLNLSSGTRATRKVLLESGLVAHLTQVLASVVHQRSLGAPFSVTLAPHSVSTTLGCLSNLLSKNRHAKVSCVTLRVRAFGYVRLDMCVRVRAGAEWGGAVSP